VSSPVSIGAAVAAYAWCLGRARRRGRSFPPARVVAFASGSIVLVLAVCGPFDDLADHSLAWHMSQHLLLIGVVAPLLLLGAPLRLVLAALDWRAGSRLAGLLNSPLGRTLSNPAFAWLQFLFVLYGAHFSGLYEAALEHPAIHVGEHGLFLASAVLFWSPLLAVAPAPHAPSHPARILALFLALPLSALLGFVFYVTEHALYAHYAAQPGALADQRRAGLIMWIAGGFPLFAAFLWCIADWGTRERRLGARM
jgi:cytochrome c oxidase assembly factor CtaG